MPRVEHHPRWGAVEIQAVCVFCSTTVRQTMPLKAYTQWQSGELIQRVWPDSTEADRCRAMGTHPECWPPEPDEEGTPSD